MAVVALVAVMWRKWKRYQNWTDILSKWNAKCMHCAECMPVCVSVCLRCLRFRFRIRYTCLPFLSNVPCWRDGKFDSTFAGDMWKPKMEMNDDRYKCIIPWVYMLVLNMMACRGETWSGKSVAFSPSSIRRRPRAGWQRKPNGCTLCPLSLALTSAYIKYMHNNKIYEWNDVNGISHEIHYLLCVIMLLWLDVVYLIRF